LTFFVEIRANSWIKPLPLTFQYQVSAVPDGRACGPPLCGGTPPATPPSKTIAHRQYALFPAVRPDQRGVCPPITRSDSLNGGSDERPGVVDISYDWSATVGNYRLPAFSPNFGSPDSWSEDPRLSRCR